MAQQVEGLSWRNQGISASDAPPSGDLYDLQARLLAKIFGAPTTGSSAVPQPAWSWPLRELYADLEKAELAPAPASAEKPAPVKNAPTQPAPGEGSGTAKTTDVSNAISALSTKIGKSGEGARVAASELVEATILADIAGQWAKGATASSQYGAPGYSATQATGAPNIPLGMAGDNQDAWCPAAKNEGAASLELTFAKTVFATEIRVRQNNAPGAIAKIEALESDGTVHVWWEGVDPYVAGSVRDRLVCRACAQDHYLVAKVKITLNLAASQGWNQIDAVQLVGTAD